jgi:hypothetical protein
MSHQTKKEREKEITGVEKTPGTTGVYVSLERTSLKALAKVIDRFVDKQII